MRAPPSQPCGPALSLTVPASSGIAFQLTLTRATAIVARLALDATSSDEKLESVLTACSAAAVTVRVVLLLASPTKCRAQRPCGGYAQVALLLSEDGRSRVAASALAGRCSAGRVRL